MKSLKQLKKPKTQPIEVSVEIRKELSVGIDDHLIKRNETNFKQVKGFHPSYTNQCSRYWYYLFQGVNVTPSFSAQTYRIFDNGHAVHSRLYSYFREMGILVAEEIPVTYDSPPIEGTADGIIDWYGHKLIELKSISSEGFHYRQLHSKPKDEHYRQAQIYMHCLDLESGYVIYENKNNQDILPIYIDRDQKFIDKLFKKYETIYHNYVNGQIPDHPYKRTSANCNSCDLAALCWAENGEIRKEKVLESEMF
jgi:CRISPR/Cas system-associated exonuclease Cas4 (RecB family)